MPTRNAVEVVLDNGNGPVVVLAEITPSEFMLAAKHAGAERVQVLAGVKVTESALLWSIKAINGHAVGFQDLDGDGLDDQLPATRHVMQLLTQWTNLHLPTEPEFAEVESSMAVQAGPGRELWRFTLPGGRVVEMADSGRRSVKDALREAAESSKSEVAQSFQQILSGCRRALRSVDGKAVEADGLKGAAWDALFSVKETHLLGHAYNKIHGTGAVDVGEAKPVPVS